MDDGVERKCKSLAQLRNVYKILVGKTAVKKQLVYLLVDTKILQ